MKKLFKLFFLAGISTIISCDRTNDKKNSGAKMNFTENQILEQLDLAYNGSPNSYYPLGNIEDVKYNFFLDLEHRYKETAGSKIHLYRDSARWAIVCEKSGYDNRGYLADIELNYIGNCINYNIEKYPERNYIVNTINVSLISPNEYERIKNNEGPEMEQFELISASATEVEVHNSRIKIEHDPFKYERLGIKLRDYDNSKHLVGFGELLRYIYETNPDLIRATEEEIKKQLPVDLPKIMTLNEFHFISNYTGKTPPSKQETFQMIAKVLVSGDTSLWRPTLKPNNHWSNWRSGNL